MHRSRLSCSLLSQSVSVAPFKNNITHQQVRNATLIRRPKRPYTFTQLVTLSDGSSYLQRTTSPEPVYSSTKDARNSAMWNPSSYELNSVEEDEAGKLSRFRERFGRGWDAKTASSETASSDRSSDAVANDNFLDLISAASSEHQQKTRRNAKEEPLDARKEEQRDRNPRKSK